MVMIRMKIKTMVNIKDLQGDVCNGTTVCYCDMEAVTERGEKTCSQHTLDKVKLIVILC